MYTTMTIKQQQVQLGHVRLILPSAQKLQGLVLLTAATGEETYQDRERRFAKPLSEHGVGVLMLTMPFYGTRRPSGQVECYIRTVSEYMLQYVCIWIRTEQNSLIKSLSTNTKTDHSQPFSKVCRYFDGVERHSSPYHFSWVVSHGEVVPQLQ